MWLTCISVLILVLMTGCSQENGPVTAKRQPASLAQAQKSYAELCAACHGIKARGAVGPDLTVSKFKYGKNRVAIVKSIMDGRPGGMPAFGSHLKPEDATALADYLLALD